MPESFSRVELWHPDVARSITDQSLVGELPFNLGAVCGDALIVNTDFLGRLDIVVNDHLLASGQQRTADLHRCEPVEMKVRNEFVREAQHYVSYVFDTALNVA